MSIMQTQRDSGLIRQQRKFIWMTGELKLSEKVSKSDEKSNKGSQQNSSQK